MSKLTKSQEELADLLLKTKTYAKVRRRKQNPDGSYEFYHVMRDTYPIDFRVTDEEFAFVHHKTNPSALLSPIIVNLRNLSDSLVDEIAEVLSEVRLAKQPDCCTGIPNAGISFAKRFAERTNIPYHTIFEKDDNPAKPQVLPAKDAENGGGKKILIIDDLITKAGSKIMAIEVAEKLGYTVAGVLVLVDREQGGVEAMQKAGYKLYAAVKLTDILRHYLQKKMIAKEQFDEAMKYLKDSKHT